MGFLGGSVVKNLLAHYRRHRLGPWVKKIPCRREWLPTPVLLPGKSHGQRSQEGYSPWGHKEQDMTEQLTLSLVFTFNDILMNFDIYIIKCYTKFNYESGFTLLYS